LTRSLVAGLAATVTRVRAMARVQGYMEPWKELSHRVMKEVEVIGIFC
jgi:hypothetical protein